MKRGLKAACRQTFDMQLMMAKFADNWTGYNRYPDEKGTESLYVGAMPVRPSESMVTTVTPMKRGLKVCPSHVLVVLESVPTIRKVTTVTPMKRGLKG